MIEIKFKQTEIGLIPEDWEITKLGELGFFSKGAGISREEAHTGTLAAIRYGEIYTSHNDYIREFYSWISEEVALKSKKLKYGDLLFTASGETKEDIGKCVAFISKEDVYAGGDIIILSIDTELQDSRYWGYYLNSAQIVKQKSARGQGDSVVHIVPRELATIEVAAPLKQEQQRIADSLSNIDQLISSLSKIIDKKRLIKQGAMQQLLTGKERLPGFDGEWDNSPLKQIANMNSGGTPLSSEPSYYNGNIHFLSISDITNSGRFIFYTQKRISQKGLEASSARLFPANTLLYAMYASIGKVAISKIDIAISQAILGFVLNSEVDLYFLYYLLDYMQEDIIRNGQTGTQTNLSKKIVENISIYYPIDVKEQSAIAEILTTMDNEIESLEEERDKYIRLKEGMMQKLLSGQIRLINVETKPIVQPKEKVANVYFRRSVLAAEIADRLCEERTFGHVKMEKLIFLTERLCHIDIDSHYHRDAAGPYDNRALRSIDSQMKKQQWFAVTKKDKGYQYQPMEKRGEHKKYFDRYYSDVLPMFDKIINTFKTSSTEQCEIVATIYSAWDDLLHGGRPFSDEDILDEVLNNWHESKRRIERSRWQKALVWMRDNGFVPQTENL